VEITLVNAVKFIDSWWLINSLGIKGVFEIVVVVLAVQNDFYLEIHQNTVFSF